MPNVTIVYCLFDASAVSNTTVMYIIKGRITIVLFIYGVIKGISCFNCQDVLIFRVKFRVMFKVKFSVRVCHGVSGSVTGCMCGIVLGILVLSLSLNCHGPNGGWLCHCIVYCWDWVCGIREHRWTIGEHVWITLL